MIILLKFPELLRVFVPVNRNEKTRLQCIKKEQTRNKAMGIRVASPRKEWGVRCNRVYSLSSLDDRGNYKEKLKYIDFVE